MGKKPAFLLVCASVFILSAFPGFPSERYEIRKRADGFRLLKNGEPFMIRGAVGQDRLDLLKDCGGNAVRVWGHSAALLDRAHAQGLKVLLSLHLPGERDGMDWNDSARVSRTAGEAIARVRSLKNHSALMMMAIGNELDWIPPGKPYNRRLWDVIDSIASEIKKLDPDHHVLTVVGDSEFDTKIREIAAQCPHLDLLGINAYGNIGAVTESVRRLWPKPYAVTEWGPVGHWQRPQTEWGVPLEQTSTEKAGSVLDHYENVIRADSAHCLGSFVFLWGWKQEITHTWYGLFSRDGFASESVDVLRFCWKGQLPFNRAPRIDAVRWAGQSDPVAVRVRPDEPKTALVACSDPDGDPLSYAWEVKPEVQPAAYAGQGEKPAEPIVDRIVTIRGAEVLVRTPVQPGPYRLFVSVFDGKGHWAYANSPFFVEAGIK